MSDSRNRCCSSANSRTPSSIASDARAPPPGPARVANADLIVVGKVAALEPEDVMLDNLKYRIAVVEVRDASRYGTVQVDSAGRLVRFLEKTGEQTPGLINAGVYVFSQAVLQHIPEGMASLENTLFPKLITQGIYAFKQDGFFIDIGTPEDYARAQELCDRFYQPISAR